MEPEVTASDRKPGSLPEITSDGDSVTYIMLLAELAPAVLRLRCDGRGNVWVSIDDTIER